MAQEIVAEWNSEIPENTRFVHKKSCREVSWLLEMAWFAQPCVDSTASWTWRQ